MSIIKHVPNILTCCSLACGCMAVVFTSQGRLESVPFLVWLAAFFDFSDGFAARLTKSSSEIGKELDSLSDMVSFGFVPGYFMYQLLSQSNSNNLFPYVGFIITIFSALRLAKFNIDTRQTDKFIGLPTPANAIFITGLVFLLEYYSFLGQTYVLLIIALIFSYLLVAELPLIALKFKNFSWSKNISKITLLTVSIILLLWLKEQAVSLVILAYILISLVDNLLGRAVNQVK